MMQLYRPDATKGSEGKVQASVVSALAVVAVMLMLSVGLVGCSPSVKVTDDSPRAGQTSISSSSDLTESSQRVEVRIGFDAPLKASGDVADDLSIEMDGEALNSKIMAVSATVDGDSLVIAITPTEQAKGPDSGSYFACYRGQLTVAAKRDDGALPHLTSDDGSTAVMDTAESFLVPSGAKIEVDGTVVGDSANAVPAQATFTVTSAATIRCCTWIQLAEGQRTYKHNHYFLRDTPAGCAEDLAQTIDETFGDRYRTSVDGATVTVTALEAVDGQTITPMICEGPVSS